MLKYPHQVLMALHQIDASVKNFEIRHNFTKRWSFAHCQQRSLLSQLGVTKLQYFCDSIKNKSTQQLHYIS